MPTYFAKNGAAITLPFGQILDSTGAEYTSAVVADVKIAKNNGTPAALHASATLVHKEVGFYELTLTTSDISAVGHATLVLSKTTYVAPPISLIVLPATVYDALVTNPTNNTGGLIAATAAISAAAGYVGSSGAAVNGTTVNTLASHDPGATLGTSTLTQAQVTGGAYALNDASFAFNASLDFTTAQKAATLARVALVDVTALNLDMRGTDNAALAATALSTVTWTPTRAGYLDNLNGGPVMLAASYSAPPSVAAIADGVWDEPQSDHLTADSTGRSLSEAYTRTGLIYTIVDDLPSAVEVADAVLTRDVDQVEDVAPVDSLCWVVLASRYNARSVTTLTVNKTTGTVFGTRTLGTTVSATYIVSMS